MKIILKDFNIDDDTEFNFFTHLYNFSFPKKERRSITNIYYLLHHNNKYTAKLAFDEDTSNFVGLLCYWNFEDFVFAEHLAVDTRIRNKGIGTQMIKLFIENINKPLILEIELPNNEISKRRLGFYLRGGFKYWEDIEYMQPAYHETTPPVPMKLLTLGDINLNETFDRVKRYLYKHVYKVALDD